MKKSLACLLFALLILCAFPSAAYAREVPDLEQNGTITFYFRHDGAKIDDGTLSLYRVGDIVEEDGNYSFAIISELGNEAVDVNATDDPQTAEALAALVKSRNMEDYQTETIADGEVTFRDVEPGLYVVVQNKAMSGYERLSPFLISMPQYENGRYETEIESYPKVPVETETEEPEPTAPTDKPAGQLPQTGQLDWPVLLLGAAGVLVFALGWMSRSGRKKGNAE